VKKGGTRAHKLRLPCGLAFCEDKNDSDSLVELVLAIWPEAPKITYSRKPLVLIRDAAVAEARKKNAANIAAVVKARDVLADVRLVVAHQDCDAVEPAHKSLADAIRTELEAAGVPNVIAVAPAWEIEAWWYLWPEAVAAVNSRWRKLTRKGNHGMIQNVKEQLRRDLHTQGVRHYEESDSAKIAAQVRNRGLIGKKLGTSDSFEAFAVRVREVMVS
jgi:hypothetical protein